MKKHILVIAGASGVGKTTIAARMLSDFTEFGFVRSITTRAKRGDGHDGEYIYTDRADFIKRAEQGELVEYMEYGDNLYGTPVSELDRIFSEGKIPLLILDIEGVKSLRKKSYDFVAVTFYIWDDLDTIEKRLYSRDLANPTAEKLLSFIKRKEMNVRDYLLMPSLFGLFDFFLKNDSVEKSASRVRELFLEASSGVFSKSKDNEAVANALSKLAKKKQ